MKKILRLCFFIFLPLLGCSSCASRQGDDPGALAFHQFPVVYAACSGSEGKTVILGVTAGYREKESLTKELTGKEPALLTEITSFASSLSADDLRNISRYEKLRLDLRDRLNGRLSRGKIEKVLFRKIEIR